MARPVAPAVHRSFRFSAELWARIEQRVAAMRAADPTMNYTAVDAVRDALNRALPPLEGPLVPPTKPRAKRTKATAKTSKRST